MTCHMIIVTFNVKEHTLYKLDPSYLIEIINSHLLTSLSFVFFLKVHSLTFPSLAAVESILRTMGVGCENSLDEML